MLLAWILTVMLNTGELQVLQVYTNQLACEVHRSTAEQDAEVMEAECVEFWDHTEKG
jgi:hypothetical protein